MPTANSEINPPWADDPVAQQAAWQAHGRKHVEPSPVHLKFRDGIRAEIRNPRGMLVLGVVITLVGLVILAGFHVGAGGALVSIGLGITWAAVTPVGIFDVRRGEYWRPLRVFHRIVKLTDVYALQLLRQGHQSFEMNLVLANGQSVTCLTQRKAERIRDVAEGLGPFLGIPVWDALDAEQMHSSVRD